MARRDPGSRSVWVVSGRKVPRSEVWDGGNVVGHRNEVAAGKMVATATAAVQRCDRGAAIGYIAAADMAHIRPGHQIGVTCGRSANADALAARDRPLPRDIRPGLFRRSLFASAGKLFLSEPLADLDIKLNYFFKALAGSPDIDGIYAG
jgi:hypothetical protein